MLTITFDSAETPATTALVNDVLRHITYTNASDAPPAQVVLAYSFYDGNSGTFKAAAESEAYSRTTTVDIAPVDDPTIARRRQRDHEREFGRLHQGARQ